jgi:Family of unknown function (DUF5343)
MITTLSVPEGNATRTMQALRFLNLLDEEGYLTDSFKRLSNAPSDEYPGLLEQILRDAYQVPFNALKPATATDQQYVNAFRLYQPKAQRNRMITLFKGLCREAGLIPGGAPETLMRQRVTTNRSGKSSASANGASRLQSEPKDAPFGPEPEYVSTPQASHSDTVTPITSTQEYVIMYGVLKKLPFDKKKWTQADREKWLNAVTAVVDMLFTLEDPQTGIGMECNALSLGRLSLSQIYVTFGSLHLLRVNTAHLSSPQSIPSPFPTLTNPSPGL